ncbi:MAG TPA: hypothetical protein VFA26_17620 [Gemmataceae bacterium]|nr:hypothetical protein [Gemmataceae bacterium]
MRPPARWVIAVLLLVVAFPLAPAADSPRPRKKAVPTCQYETRTVEGWTVHVNKALLNEQRELGAKALRLLEVKLYDISRVVPAKALAELRKVPIWLGVEDGSAPCAEYHPSKDWLTQHGYNPDKAKAVEIGSAARFVEWSKEQPWMVLHELAHAYHDRVLGFDHAGVKAAYEAAKGAKLYESVLHVRGRKERAYAIRNHHEYFAEGTEAYFGTNDFYPFVRGELKQHDPRLYKVLEEVWGK